MTSAALCCMKSIYYIMWNFRKIDKFHEIVDPLGIAPYILTRVVVEWSDHLKAWELLVVSSRSQVSSRVMVPLRCCSTTINFRSIVPLHGASIRAVCVKISTMYEYGLSYGLFRKRSVNHYPKRESLIYHPQPLLTQKKLSNTTHNNKEMKM